MAEICKNCEYEIALNFCANCGQKKAKRIDRIYIKDEIQYTVLHMNKGFLFSIKKILRAPGKTAREFVEGNRVNHYKPILLVFVVAGISAFLTNSLFNMEEMMIKNYELQGFSKNVASGMSSFVVKYSSIIMLLLVPFMALFTWIAFRKWGYNYYENVVINAYSLVCYQVLSILIVLPVYYLLKNDYELFFKIPGLITVVLMIVVFLWFYLDFYSGKSARSVILRLLLFLLMVSFSFIILMVIAGVGMGIYMAANDIDPTTIIKVKN